MVFGGSLSTSNLNPVPRANFDPKDPQQLFGFYSSDGLALDPGNTHVHGLVLEKSALNADEIVRNKITGQKGAPKPLIPSGD